LIWKTCFNSFKNRNLQTEGPVQIAFHIYELLREAGYEDKLIEEVSAALADSRNGFYVCLLETLPV